MLEKALDSKKPSGIFDLLTQLHLKYIKKNAKEIPLLFGEVSKE